MLPFVRGAAHRHAAVRAELLAIPHFCAAVRAEVGPARPFGGLLPGGQVGPALRAELVVGLDSGVTFLTSHQFFLPFLGRREPESNRHRRRSSLGSLSVDIVSLRCNSFPNPAPSLKPVRRPASGCREESVTRSRWARRRPCSYRIPGSTRLQKASIRRSRGSAVSNAPQAGLRPRLRKPAVPATRTRVPGPAPGLRREAVRFGPSCASRWLFSVSNRRRLSSPRPGGRQPPDARTFGLARTSRSSCLLLLSSCPPYRHLRHILRPGCRRPGRPLHRRAPSRSRVRSVGSASRAAVESVVQGPGTAAARRQLVRAEFYPTGPKVNRPEGLDGIGFADSGFRLPSALLWIRGA